MRAPCDWHRPSAPWYSLNAQGIGGTGAKQTNQPRLCTWLCAVLPLVDLFADV